MRTHVIPCPSLKPGLGGCRCPGNLPKLTECFFGDPVRQEKNAVHMAKGAVVCRVQDCRKGKRHSQLSLKGEDRLPGDMH